MKVRGHKNIFTENKDKLKNINEHLFTIFHLIHFLLNCAENSIEMYNLVNEMTIKSIVCLGWQPF